MANLRCSLFGLLLLLAFTGYASAARTATQKAYAVCIKDNAQNRLTMKFTLDLQSDPTGSLEVYNPPSGLVCPFTSSNAKYEKTVNLDRYGLGTPSPPAGESGCGYSYQLADMAVTWEFIYNELPNRHDVDLGLNRIYTVTCDTNSIVENEVEAQISVSTPDLNQNAKPYVPNVRYFIEAETAPRSNVYAEVGTNPLPVQTNLKLVLEYVYGTVNENRYNSIAGLTTIVSPNQQFTSERAFLTDKGCPTGSLAPSTGFKRVFTNVATGTYRLETAVFPAFRFDARTFNFVYFKTQISFCSSLADSFCSDPCTASSKRRRRSTGNETEEVLIARIQIVDSLDNTEAEQQREGETLLFAAVGACIAICVLLTVLLCVYLFVFRRRRNNPENKLQGFDNKTFNDSK